MRINYRLCLSSILSYMIKKSTCKNSYLNSKQSSKKDYYKFRMTFQPIQKIKIPKCSHKLSQLPFCNLKCSNLKTNLNARKLRVNRNCLNKIKLYVTKSLKKLRLDWSISLSCSYMKEMLNSSDSRVNSRKQRRIK